MPMVSTNLPISDNDLASVVPPGVVSGDHLHKLYAHAQDNGYAIPAFNYSDSVTCNSILMAAKRSCSPVVIRITYATCKSACGKFTTLLTDEEDTQMTVAQGVALALHVRTMAAFYKVPVILQSETQCHYRLSTWYEGLLAANKSFFAQYRVPLFSSHILDLTTEADIQDEQEILAIGKRYLKELDQLKIWMGLKIHSSQESVWNAFVTMSRVSNRFSLVVSSFPSGLCSSDGGFISMEGLKKNPLILDEGRHFDSSIDCDLENIPNLSSKMSEKLNVIQVNVGSKRILPQSDSVLQKESGACTELDTNSWGKSTNESETVVARYSKVMQTLHSEYKYSYHSKALLQQQDPSQLSFWDFVDELRSRE